MKKLTAPRIRSAVRVALIAGALTGSVGSVPAQSASRSAGAPPVRAQLTLRTETKTNLRAENAVAVIPGRSQEAIVLDAHADAWFDGAGDNGDGLAVLVGLARHLANPANRPDRTLVLLASAGHHTAGLNGPRGFVAANPDLVKRTVLVVNIEHVAQRNFGPGRHARACDRMSTHRGAYA